MEYTLYDINALVTSLSRPIYNTSTTSQTSLSPIFSKGRGESVHRLIAVPFCKIVNISKEVFETELVLNLIFRTDVP